VENTKKDVIMWLIILSFCVVIMTGLIGLTLDTVLTDIRNLKENDVYWLRNQVKALQTDTFLIKQSQHYDTETILERIKLLDDKVKIIQENTTPMTWEELMEEAMSEDYE